MLKIELSTRALKFLRKIPTKHARQIENKLTELQINPKPPDAKLLKGMNTYWRADSGEYRIVYEVTSDILAVGLIGKRNDDEIYNQLKRLTILINDETGLYETNNDLEIT